MGFSETAQASVLWRARALDRSLAVAHARSVARMERLVAAARDLANETGNAAFTMAQLAERTGLSLKTVYRCFAGKDDLLLALLEEDSHIGAELLTSMVERHRDPVERLRAFVSGLFEMLTHPGAIGYAGVLVREHRRLSEERYDDLRIALSPLTGLLAAELASAIEAGAIGPRDPVRTAEAVFGLLLGGIHEVTLGRAEPREEATFLWDLVWGGLASRGRRRTRRR